MTTTIDFSEAIKAHVQWKIRLGLFLTGAEPLEEATVRRDDVCALGCWIHGAGLEHASRPEYQALLDDHAAFHRAAAEVIRVAAAGDINGAKQMLDIDSKYADSSKKVVLAISRLRTAIGG